MEKPNIVIFFTDDQRYDTIHALGCDEIKTPNFDQFANESIAFTQAHIMGGTCGAVCMPSRAMMQTGRDVFSLYGKGTSNGAIIPEEHIMMPEYLKKHGYYTHHIGKWHQDRASFMRAYSNATRICGLTKEWCGTMGGHFNPCLMDYDETGKFEDEQAYHLSEQYEKIPMEYGTGKIHSTDVFVDAALDFIENYHQEDPFYLYIATVAPHDPRNAPQKYEEMYSPDSVSLPKNFLPVHPFDNGELYVRDEKLEWFPRREYSIRRHIADYYSMISHLDDRFGELIRTLKEKQLYENTIVIVAGDNGLALGQHGLLGKQSVYDHSIRVPLMIKPIGKFEAKKTDDYCYLFDIFPTLCDMIDLKIPNTVTGKSMKNVLDGTGISEREDIFAVYRNLQRTYKNKQYKIIEYHVNSESENHIQLFDLLADPWESINLAKKPEYKDILNEMHAKLVSQELYYKDPLLMESKESLGEPDIW
ncbi:MAG: sulfatase-like hydrolase/transferase [Eubacteriales bacterium]